MNKVNILGAYVDKCNIEQASDKIMEMINNNQKCGYVFTPNSEILMQAYRDKEFCDILNTASLLTADGIGVVYASRILKNPINERCAGFDVTCRLFEKMAQDGKTVYLFGSKPGVAEVAKTNIEKKYSGIKVVGCSDGYFDEEKEKLIKEMEGWKTPQLKPQIEPMVMAQKPKEGTFIENWIKYNVGLVNTTESLDGMFPGNIMEVSKRVRSKERDSKIEHLTVKPVMLISHLVKLFTKEGQVVLDPFMGSGSHCLAALENNRKFIGFEIEKAYFDICEDRIKNQSNKEELEPMLF